MIVLSQIFDSNEMGLIFRELSIPETTPVKSLTYEQLREISAVIYGNGFTYHSDMIKLIYRLGDF